MKCAAIAIVPFPNWPYSSQRAHSWERKRGSHEVTHCQSSTGQRLEWQASLKQEGAANKRHAGIPRNMRLRLDFFLKKKKQQQTKQTNNKTTPLIRNESIIIIVLLQVHTVLHASRNYARENVVC